MYIDPNTGGMLFQALALLLCAAPVALFAIGGLAVAVIFIKKKNDQKSSKIIHQ